MVISNEEIFNLLQEVAKSVNDTKEELVSLKQELKGEIENIKSENLKLKGDVESLKSKLQAVEKRQKKYNLVVYGLKEDELETKNQLLHLINNILDINCGETEFRDIYKIGKSEENKKRPTVVEFVRYQAKLQILQKTKTKNQELRKEGIQIVEDLTTEDYIKNKFLHSQAKIVRQKGHKASVKKSTLVVNGITYSYKELKAKLENSELDTFSFPVQPEHKPTQVTASYNLSEEKRKPTNQGQHIKYTLRGRKGSSSNSKVPIENTV